MIWRGLARMICSSCTQHAPDRLVQCTIESSTGKADGAAGSRGGGAWGTEQQAKVTAEAAGRTSSQAEATRRTTASKGRPTATTTTAPTY
jgi:hypothetical protein